MKRLISGLALAFALSVAPAFAQHTSHASSPSVASHSTASSHSAPSSHSSARGNQHPGKQTRQHQGNNTWGQHQSGRPTAAWHNDHVGYGHRFYMRRFRRYGSYYNFWYDGFWFSFYDPWPADWCYCDQFYTDYDVSTDCYFLYNYSHPGFRIRIGLVF